MKFPKEDNYSNVEAYKILKKLEEQLRRFIETELAQYDKKWWEQLIYDRPNHTLKNKAEGRKRRDELRKEWIFAEHPLISYIDFKDYVKIITWEENWNDVFKYVFHDDKAISKLQGLEPTRNTISHSRNLDREEFNRFKSQSEAIRNAISYYYDNKKKIEKLKVKVRIEKKIPSVISVSFDKTVYPLGSKVYVRANIPNIIKGKLITFEVSDSTGKVLITKQLDPEKYQDPALKEEGLYETFFVMEGNDWKVGETYELKCIHDSAEAYDKATIDARKPVLQSDKSIYLWGSDMILTVIDPDADKDSDVAEFVGDRDDSKLIIKSGKNQIKDYRLRETGDSTGIFQGLIGFIGVEDNEKIDLPKCSLDNEGNVTCKVSKTTFDAVQKLGKTPKRLLLEIE